MSSWERLNEFRSISGFPTCSLEAREGVTGSGAGDSIEKRACTSELAVAKRLESIDCLKELAAKLVGRMQPSSILPSPLLPDL